MVWNELCHVTYCGCDRYSHADMTTACLADEHHTVSYNACRARLHTKFHELVSLTSGFEP